MSADRVDRTQAVTTRPNKTRPDEPEVSSRENPKYIAGGCSRRVEMSADRHDRTQAVTTRLPNCDPTKRKSVRETLRKIQVERYEGG